MKKKDGPGLKVNLKSKNLLQEEPEDEKAEGVEQVVKGESGSNGGQDARHVKYEKGCAQRMAYSGVFYSNILSQEPVSSLPALPEIFYVDPGSFDYKPWRSEQADLTDYFNFGMNEKSWNEYRKRAQSQMEMLTEIQQHGDALKNNQFRKVQKPHPSLSYELPVDFGGMGHFFFRRFLFNNVNLFPEEIVDYTPTLKQGVKTNSGEQTCYLGLDRRNNFKPNGSQPLTTFDPINELLSKLMPTSESSDSGSSSPPISRSRIQSFDDPPHRRHKYYNDYRNGHDYSGGPSRYESYHDSGRDRYRRDSFHDRPQYRDREYQGQDRGYRYEGRREKGGGRYQKEHRNRHSSREKNKELENIKKEEELKEPVHEKSPAEQERVENEVRDVEVKRGGGRTYQGMYTRFSSESHEVNGNEERGNEPDPLLEREKQEDMWINDKKVEQEWRQEKRKKKKHHRDKNREDESVRGSISRKHKHKHKKRSERADKESERSYARYS